MNKERLIEEHSGLIYKLAHYYQNNSLVEDLYQVGIIGLLKAYENYDESKNVKFSTYAFDYIRGEMLSYIKKDNPIKVSKEYLHLRKSYESAKDMMTQKMGKVPSKYEVCLFLDIDESLIDDVLLTTDSVLSLDYENDETNLYDTLSNTNIDQIDNKLYVDSLLENLSPLEKKIIEYRYFKDYTQTKVASELGISQVEVFRTERKSILKLKKVA